jgi:hypothetical protein
MMLLCILPLDGSAKAASGEESEGDGWERPLSLVWRFLQGTCRSWDREYICSFYLFSSNITWRSWFSSISTYSVSPANKVVISLLLVNDFWLYVCESTQRRSSAAILPNPHLVFAWLLLFLVLSRFYIRHHRHAAFPVGLQLYDIGSARP